MASAFVYSSCVGSGEPETTNALIFLRARRYDTEALTNFLFPKELLPDIDPGEKFHFYNPDTTECYYFDGVDFIVADTTGYTVLDGFETLGIIADAGLSSDTFWTRLCGAPTDPGTPGGGSGSYAMTIVGTLTADPAYLASVTNDDPDAWGQAFSGSHPTWANTDTEDRPLYKTENGTTTGNMVPVMTGTSAPSGTASASLATSGNEAWKAFDNDSGTSWESDAGFPAWLQYQFPSAKTATSYAITADVTPTLDPTDWTLEGSNDGSTWTTLDTVSGESFTSGQRKTFTPTTTGSYSYYRLNISAGTDTAIVRIARFELIGTIPAYSDVPWIDETLTNLHYDAGGDVWIIELYLPDGTLLAGYLKDTGTSAVGVYSRDAYDTAFTGAGVGTGSDWAMIA